MMRFSANDQTVTGHARDPEETRMPTRSVPRLAWLAGAALLLAACGGTGPAAQPPSPATTIAASETTAEPDEGGTNQSGEGEGGCPARGPRPPGGRTIEADVDGDGAADQVWLAGGAKGARVGVTTKAGAGAELKIGTAKPPAVLGAEDANGDGRAEIFVRTAGTQGAQVVDHVTLAVWSGCGLRWVTNCRTSPTRSWSARATPRVTGSAASTPTTTGASTWSAPTPSASPTIRCAGPARSCGWTAPVP